MLVDSLLCVRCPQTPWIGMTYWGGRWEGFISQHLSISYYSLCKVYPLGLNLTALPDHIPESPKTRGQEFDKEETGEVCSSFEKSEKDPKWKRNICGWSCDSPQSCMLKSYPQDLRVCLFGVSLAVMQLRCSHLGGLSNKTVVLMRGDQDMAGHRRRATWRSREKTALWKPKREGPEEANPVSHLEFGLQKLWEYKLLLCKTLSLRHFIMAALEG